MKKWRILYISLFLCLCLAPVLLIPLFGHQKLENDTAAAVWPALTENGKLNRNYFSQVSDYVDQNIAFRRQLVSANGLLMRAVFKSSSQDNVVVGKDGFLFYSSSLDTYTGRNSMNSRQLHNAAVNLRLLQDILSDDGIRFVFTIAPNKNSLYGQYMPDRYQADPSSRSVTALTPLLKEMQVNYADLFALFENTDEILYHKTDSHWNNRGAAMAAFRLLKAADLAAEDYSEGESEIRNDFQGDLFAMICPAFVDHEREIYYQRPMTYRYVTDTQSNYDPLIQTANEQSALEQSIVVFRDSFGNSLLPFLADQVREGYFSRNMPIDAKTAADRGSDVLIWEIVERNLSMLQEEAPVIAGREEAVLHPGENLHLSDLTPQSLKHNMMKPSLQEGMVCIQGNLDAGSISDNSLVYILLTPAGTGEGEKDTKTGKEKQGAQTQPLIFQAFQTGGANGSGCGYCLYLDPALLTSDAFELSLIIRDPDEAVLSEPLQTLELSSLLSSQEGRDSENGAETSSPSASAENALELAQQYIGRPVSELIADFGEPLSSSTGPSCNSPGDDGQYVYEGFTVYTQSQERGGEQIIQHILEQ